MCFQRGLTQLPAHAVGLARDVVEEAPWGCVHVVVVCAPKSCVHRGSSICFARRCVNSKSTAASALRIRTPAAPRTADVAAEEDNQYVAAHGDRKQRDVGVVGEVDRPLLGMSVACVLVCGCVCVRR